MKQIVRLKLSYLRNEEHYQFYTAFKTLAEQTGAENLNIGALYATFLALLQQLGEVIELLRKSGLSDSITDLDNVRDNLHRGISKCLDAYLYHFDPACVAAAKRLKQIVDHYGNLRVKPYNEETASISNLLQDMRQHAADMELLHITEWVDKLDESNQTFDAVLNERYSESAAMQQLATVRRVRTEIDAVYRQMIQVIDAFAIAMPDGAFAGFINEWNARVDYYKRTVDLRKAKNKKEEEKDEEEGEQLSN